METSLVWGRGKFFLVRENLGGELGEPGTMKGDNERGILRTFFFWCLLVVDFDRYFVHRYGLRTHMYCSCPPLLPPLVLSQRKETLNFLPSPKVTKKLLLAIQNF